MYPLMDSALSDLRKFAESFFVNLGCAVASEGKHVIVSGVPADFESAYGKPGPYRISFESASNNEELLSRGSFLLKTMMNYLEQRGQTALIKLVFDQDYLAAFKRSFSFKQCELVSLTKKPCYHPLYLFSFSTTLQYLNEKEQVMNTVAVRDGVVVPFSLEQYAYEQGNPKDLGSIEVKPSYNCAKEALKVLIAPRVEEISQVLAEKIARETDRITEHYGSQLREKEYTRAKIREQLATLDKASPLSASMAQRRDRLIENLRLLEDTQFESKLTEEQDFFIRDEEFKHSLNVSNKLVSTTLVYYPIFMFTLTLKNKDVSRSVLVSYNPLKNDFETPVSCEQCARVIQELFLCGSAHVLCANCFDSCRTCERGMCALCMKKTCSQCARKLCKRCVSRCTVCWKDVCKTHLRVNYATGSEGCTSCLRQCSRCGSFADKAHLARDLDGSELCVKCASLSKVIFR